MFKAFKFLALAAVCAALVLGGAAAQAKQPQTALYQGTPAKYVFYFIGDGMGTPQRTAAEQTSGQRLVIDSFPAQGITTTYASDRFITDSAAAATALASGKKTKVNYIGVDENFKPFITVAEIAKKKGMKVGIVSSVSIDHATPACFYAHVEDRDMYHEIDHALAESNFDYFAGGGLKDPAGKRKLKKDPAAKTMGDALEKAQKNGFKVVTKKDEFLKLAAKDGRVFAYNEWLQDSGALPYAMDTRPQDITLAEFTKKGIELLDNPKGFFMMVEGGKIDWACHANDAMASVEDTLAFDAAVAEAVAFARKHPKETLIVVTGDHECGGLTLGFAGTQYESNFDLLKNQKISFQKFDDEVMKDFKGDFAAIKPIITKEFGLKFEGDAKTDPMVLLPHELATIEESFQRAMKGDSMKSKDPKDVALYGGYNPLTVALTHTLNQKAGLGWTSFSHTGVPVSTSAMGVGAATFNGYYDNTDVALKVMAIMGAKASAQQLAMN